MRGCSKFNLFPALGYLVKKYQTKELGDKKESLPSNSLILSEHTLMCLVLNFAFWETTTNLGRAGRVPRIPSKFGEWAQKSLSNESPPILHNGPGSSQDTKFTSPCPAGEAQTCSSELPRIRKITQESQPDKLDPWLWEGKHRVIKRVRQSKEISSAPRAGARLPLPGISNLLPLPIPGWQCPAGWGAQPLDQGMGSRAPKKGHFLLLILNYSNLVSGFVVPLPPIPLSSPGSTNLQGGRWGFARIQ